MKIRRVFECMYGCNCKRGDNGSEATTSKLECVLQWISVAIFLYITICFYFWATTMDNDYDLFNMKMTAMTGQYMYWDILTRTVTDIVFLYTLLIVVLGFALNHNGKPVDMGLCHKIAFFILLCLYIGVQVAMYPDYPHGWALVATSIHMFGLYLHIGLVIIITTIGWFVTDNLARERSIAARCVIGAVFCAFMLLAYIWPVALDSPCATGDALPSRPLLTAHRGLSSIAPENTFVSFEKALEISDVITAESDVSISADAIPYLFHDENLLRTTNAADIFPGAVQEPAATFTMSQVKQLDAGSWFLETDPHRNVASLGDADWDVYANQSVPTLAEMLAFLKPYDVSFMFDIKSEEYESDIVPDYNETDQELIKKAISDSGFPPHRILWLLEADAINETVEYTKVAKVEPSQPHSLETLKVNNISILNVRHDHLDWRDISKYTENNISVNMYTVNSKWLFSYAWCAGLTSVTSNFPQVYQNMDSPQLHMSRTVFVVVWAVVDSVSFIVIAAMLIFKCVRRNQQDGLSLHQNVGMKNIF